MDEFKPYSKSDASISSLRQLAQALSIPVNELNEIAALTEEEKYVRKELPKVDGSKRVVYSLHPKMRLLQSRINKRIFKELVIFPCFLFGSVPSKNDAVNSNIKRDYVSCAKAHCGAKTVLKVDISNFFDNIHKDLVREVFNNVLNIREEALEYVTNQCCKGDFVVQGALTSSYIATLCLYKKEGDIYKRAKRKNLVYTRLVDDITVSSKINGYDFSQILNHIENMLSAYDLPINKRKTKIFNCSSEPIKVHGLRVDYQSPRLPSDEVKRIRASLHNLKKLAVKNNTKTSIAYRKEFNRCMGRINKLGRVNHNKYELFKGQLLAIKPMPSPRDIRIVEAAINSIEASFSKGNSDKHWYKRKYNLTIYKLIILTRSKKFNAVVDAFKERLKKVKPA
ncbi:reverse transcriptase family protein [Serratia rubidaea]|uniref:reverse transcriptase family protein n=1 Tax=Serratia rubidaea TaxID=61652 RepID=UPI0009005367|nr:reverse transcriptase family protein [Serratia rubidaea]